MKFKLILFLSLFLTVVSIGAILGGSQQKTQNLSPTILISQRAYGMPVVSKLVSSSSISVNSSYISPRTEIVKEAEKLPSNFSPPFPTCNNVTFMSQPSNITSFSLTPTGNETSIPYIYPYIDSSEPAPMGIADFGLNTNTGAAYSYNTTGFLGTAVINSLTTCPSGDYPYWAGFQLNVIMQYIIGSTVCDFWCQNCGFVNTQTNQITFGDWIFNMTSPNANMSGSAVSGQGGIENNPSVYYNWAPNMPITLTYQSTIQFEITATSLDDLPQVGFSYNVGSGWVSIDAITFNVGGITQERNLIVDGLETVPDSGLAQDAEFDLCGKIGGANTTATSCNMNMMLQYYNGTAFQGIPYGFNFGGDTGEKISNIIDQLMPAKYPLTAGGSFSAQLTTGPGTLGSMPSAPLSLVASSYGSSVSLAWDAPANKGNSTISDYFVYRGTSPNNELCLDTVNTTSYTDNGVTPGSTYYYSITAINGIGEGPQSNVVNIQPLVSPVLNAISPNPSYTGSIALSWNAVAGATSYQVFRDTTQITSLSEMEPMAEPSNPYYTDTLNTPGTYYYVVVAMNYSAYSFISNNVYVTTSVPNTPLLYTISPNPSYNGSISLSWNADTEATGYYVFRDTNEITTTTGLNPIAQLTGTTYNDTIETAGTYYYAIIAKDPVGNSSHSNNEDVTTAVPDIPTLILNSPNPDYTGSIELSWAAVYGGFEYYVFRNTTQIASVTGLNSIAQLPYSPFTDTILAPGTYYYVVTAADQIGNSSLSNCINITVSVPITPVKNLISPNPSVTGSITLSWNANPWATGFYLFKNTSLITTVSGLNFIANLTTNSYVDTLGMGMYYYAVIARDLVGNSSLSNCVNVTVGVPLTPLLTLISPNPCQNGSVSLSWTAQVGTTWKYIFRNTTIITTIAGLAPIAQIANNTYTDTLGVGDAGTFYYVVLVSSPMGNSSLSNCVNVNVTVMAPVMNLITPNPDYIRGFTISWSTVPEGTGYYLFGNTSFISSTSGLSALTYVATLASSYNITMYWVAGTYYFALIASNIFGNSSLSNCVNVTVSVPPTPILDQISPNPNYGGIISLSWVNVTGANQYYIYRDQNPIISVTELNAIATLAVNSYTDTVKTLGTYYYAIIASSDVGNSSLSNCESVTISVPTTITINAISPNPINSGSIPISWTNLGGGVNYYLYRNIIPFTTISDLNYIANISTNIYNDMIGAVGTYYYAVYATSLFGTTTLSNYVNVTVEGNEWPMFQGDPTHTGVGVIGLGTNYSYAWKYATESIINSAPVVSDGRVYIGSSDNHLYCLNATTGAQIWNYTTGGSIFSSPVVAGGYVYVGSQDFRLYCLNAITGVQIWNYTAGSTIDHSSPIVVAGYIYIGSDKLYCLNAITGEELWNFTTGGLFESSPAVTGGCVYIGSFDSNLYCMNATTGEQIWNYTTGSSIESSPTVVGGDVYVGSEDGNLYCLNAITGDWIWNYTTKGGIDSSPAVARNYVYIGSYDDNIYCLNAITGEWIWNYTTGGFIESSPAVAGGYVYIGSSDGDLYCLNMTNGNLIWNYTTGDGIFWSSPAVASGCIYIGSLDDCLYCFKPNSVTSAPIIQSITPNPNHSGEIPLYWGPISGAVSYNVYRFTSEITTLNSSLTKFSSIDASTWWDSLSSDGIYYYVVTAVNLNGESVISTCVNVTVLPPFAPVLNLIIPNPSSNGTIYLSWVSVDGAVSYNVYRFTSMITNINGSLTFVTNTKLTSAVDTELTNGTYYYAITAVSASGESTNSNCQYIIIAIPLSNSTSTTTTTTIPNSSTSTSSNNPQINNIEIGLISGGIGGTVVIVGIGFYFKSKKGGTT